MKKLSVSCPLQIRVNDKICIYKTGFYRRGTLNYYNTNIGHYLEVVLRNSAHRLKENINVDPERPYNTIVSLYGSNSSNFSSKDSMAIC